MDFERFIKEEYGYEGISELTRQMISLNVIANTDDAKIKFMNDIKAEYNNIYGGR